MIAVYGGINQCIRSILERQLDNQTAIAMHEVRGLATRMDWTDSVDGLDIL